MICNCPNDDSFLKRKNTGNYLAERLIMKKQNVNPKNDNSNDDEDMFVDIELDEGTVTCKIITIFECDKKDYIAILPVDENEKPVSEDVWIYGYSEDEEGNPDLHYIDDDDEYDAAADAFDEYLDEQMFNGI